MGGRNRRVCWRRLKGAPWWLMAHARFTEVISDMNRLTPDSNYIGGKWAPAASRSTVLSPMTGLAIASAPLSGQDDVNSAVASARAAFPSWSRTSVPERCATVKRLASWLNDNYGAPGEATELKTLLNRSVGKPLPEADIEVIESATFIDYFCEVAPQILAPRNVPLSPDLWPTKESSVVFDAIGVVGIITPWNYPLEMPIWTLIPALLAGNTVVLKPSEKSSIVGLVFGEMADAAGLPPGVLNVIAGDKETGQMLVSHPQVNMISFTGSVAAGKWIAEACGRQLKKVTLELGGNDAAIVLDDVDLELAANGLVWGAFCNAGQVCVGTKRAYVPRSIADRLIPIIVEKSRALRLGVDVGPIIDENQRGAVEHFIKDAIDRGGELLTGGHSRDIDGALYIEPTVIGNMNGEMALANEECFGPVLPIMIVDSEREAILAANDSIYGLGASVWTADRERGVTIAEQLNAGMVWINDVNVAFSETPWGGRKMSGQGFELSPECFLQYVNRKHINVENGTDVKRAWWYPY
jgi:acyl-CoA reductase-like NAD-dependent aldehyde dehydrogenase